MNLPATGRTRDEVLVSLQALRKGDANWRDGRVFSLVYWAGDDVLDLVKQASLTYFSENGLNPTAFPSLRRMETEVLQMVAGLLHHPEAAGSMTSGGTESILMAVKTARDWARHTRPGIKAPKMILPVTAHPAFEKAAKYFDVEAVHAPIGPDFRVDVAAVEQLIDGDTILLVGSAPQYPHGVIDPIEELGALAQKRQLLLHVDSCVGGMMLPFVEKLGHALPPFDFRVPGVTSMSCDLHKYGWAAKGASTVLYRSRELRQHQFLAYPDWPGGLFGSPSMLGTRAGGPIAAAWAVMNYLGEEGYLKHAHTTLEATRALLDGVRKIPGLFIFGKPHMTVFSIGAEAGLDIYAIADRMGERGWFLDRQQRPPSLHLTITPAHAAHVPAILDDLRTSVEEVRKAGANAAPGAAAMYGMLGSLPDRGSVGNFILEFLDGLDRV